MKIAHIQYQTHLKTHCTHLDSNDKIQTDAPIDNNGEGSTFSPTDLLSTSLAACMFTLMGIKADKSGFEFLGAEAVVEKFMAVHPRRVERIVVRVNMQGSYSQEEREILEEAARNCPVAKSLHPDLIQEVRFEYA